MYSKWLDEDNEEIDISEETLQSLKDQLKDVQGKLSSHSEAQSAKSDTLEEKEKRLKAYQYKIQQKQEYLDKMADILVHLNQTKTKINVAIDADPDEYIWDDVGFPPSCAPRLCLRHRLH